MAENVTINSPLKFDSKERVAYELFNSHLIYLDDEKRKEIMSDKGKLLTYFGEFLHTMTYHAPFKK